MKKSLKVIIMVLGVFLISACGKVVEEEVKLVDAVQIDDFGVIQYNQDKDVYLDVKGIGIDVDDVKIVPVNENFSESYLEYRMTITNNTKEHVYYDVGDITLATGEGTENEKQYFLAHEEYNGIDGVEAQMEDEEEMTRLLGSLSLDPREKAYVKLIWVIEEEEEEGIYDNFKDFTVTFIDVSGKESAKIKYKM